MLRTNQQRPLGQAAKLLEVEDQVVFTATGVLERITLAQGRRNRDIDAPVNPEGELSYSTGKGDP